MSLHPVITLYNSPFLSLCCQVISRSSRIFVSECFFFLHLILPPHLKATRITTSQSVLRSTFLLAVFPIFEGGQVLALQCLQPDRALPSSCPMHVVMLVCMHSEFETLGFLSRRNEICNNETPESEYNLEGRKSTGAMYDGGRALFTANSTRHQRRVLRLIALIQLQWTVK